MRLWIAFISLTLGAQVTSITERQLRFSSPVAPGGALATLEEGNIGTRDVPRAPRMEIGTVENHGCIVEEQRGMLSYQPTQLQIVSFYYRQPKEVAESAMYCNGRRAGWWEFKDGFHEQKNVCVCDNWFRE